MAELGQLAVKYQIFLRMYRWQRIEPIPWAPLGRPLDACRVALVSTAGFVPSGHAPFDPAIPGGDVSFRLVPSETPAAELVESHKSDAFDHAGIRADPNLAFPVDRIRELADAGRIGLVAATHLSFMGSITAPRRLMRETAPRAAEHLVQDRVDVALVVPVCPMCNQTACLIAAELERRGITTIAIQLLRTVAEKVRPPRALLVPFPHGYPLHRPNDPRVQTAVIEAALREVERAEPGPPRLAEYAVGGG